MKFVKKIKFKGSLQKNAVYQKSPIFRDMGLAYLDSVENFEQVMKISGVAYYFHSFFI